MKILFSQTCHPSQREPQTTVVPDCNLPTVKNIGGIVMTWGVISGKSVGPQAYLQGSTITKVYLSSYLISFILYFGSCFLRIAQYFIMIMHSFKQLMLFSNSTKNNLGKSIILSLQHSPQKPEKNMCPRWNISNDIFHRGHYKNLRGF